MQLPMESVRVELPNEFGEKQLTLEFLKSVQKRINIYLGFQAEI